jgi:hypothetical protein
MSTNERIDKMERLLRRYGIDVDAEEPKSVERTPPAETFEAGAARLGVGVAELRTIASSLGAKAQEIGGVEQTADGLVVMLKGDRNRVILRSADRPDAEGNTGWLRLPHPNPEVEEARVRNSRTGLPVFVRPTDDLPGVA